MNAMGLIDWLFDEHGQDGHAAEEAAHRARSELSSMHRHGYVHGTKLERALGDLALATKTLQRVLVEKGICSSEDLASAMERIEREGGPGARGARTP